MLRVLCLILGLGTMSLTAGESSSEKKTLGFASPEEAWEAYRLAQHEGRWKKAFQCLTPGAQERVVMRFVYTAAYLGRTQEKATAKKLKTILKNHGLDLQQIEAEAEKHVSKDEAARYAKELNRRVKDREQLFQEAMTLLDPVVPHPKDKDGKRMIAWGKLTKIEMDGDRATGECIKKLDDRTVFEVGGVRQTEMTQDVKLHRINGRWFVDWD